MDSKKKPKVNVGYQKTPKDVETHGRVSLQKSKKRPKLITIHNSQFIIHNYQLSRILSSEIILLKYHAN